MTKNRSRLLALAAATVAAAASLTACASAQPTPESVALDFMSAFATNDGKLPSEFMCEGAPKSAADNGRWTTDLASDLKVGGKSEIDNDGYQKIEVTYVRAGSPSDMVVKVDTKNLCLTDAGSHLKIDSEASPSKPTEEPEESTAQGSSESNPLAVDDGTTLLFDDLRTDIGDEVFLTATPDTIFTISGSSPLEIRDAYGLEASQSDIGVGVVVSRAEDWQILELWDIDQDISIVINVIVE